MRLLGGQSKVTREEAAAGKSAKSVRLWRREADRRGRAPGVYVIFAQVQDGR